MNPFEKGTEEHAAWEKQEATVLDRLHDYLGRFVAYPSGHAQIAHALWIVHTHLMEAWESTPRIAFLSPEPGSGKTRALEVMEPLVPRAVEAVNVTPAYLFRKVGDLGGAPTILYDEIDTVFGPKAKDNEEIRGLLNAGHRRGAVAGRCVVKGKLVETEEIPAYCAVALAGLGGLPDTILSRSVIVKMRRRAPGEQVEPYRRRVHVDQARGLYDDIVAWAAWIEGDVMKAWPELPDTITDRDADVWEPLIAIADAAGGDWPRKARVAAVALVADSKENTPSLGIRLLTDLRSVFRDYESMTSEQILSGLYLIEDGPWNTIKDKQLDNRGLANLLRPYGVNSRNVRIGMSVRKGFYREDLIDAWLRYCKPVADVADVADSMGDEPSSATTTVERVSVHRDPSMVNVTDTVTGSVGTPPLETATSATALHGNCCDGGTLKPSCKLCPSSPTYWKAAA